jgi:hypothetical protein
MLQSKPGWDFVARGADSIRLARDECAGGEPARLVRMGAIMHALGDRLGPRCEAVVPEGDMPRGLG